MQSYVFTDVLVLTRHVVAVRTRRCESLDSVTSSVSIERLLVRTGERTILTSHEFVARVDRSRCPSSTFLLHHDHRLFVLIGRLHGGVVGPGSDTVLADCLAARRDSRFSAILRSSRVGIIVLGDIVIVDADRLGLELPS